MPNAGGTNTPVSCTWRHPFSSSGTVAGGLWARPRRAAAARFSCCPCWYLSMRAWSWLRLARITSLAAVLLVALISKMV